MRVDSSKKSVATTLPRRVGTLGTERRSTSAKASATRRTSAMPVGPEVGDRERCSRSPRHLSSRVPIQTPSSPTSTISSRRVGQVLAHVVGADGQLAVAAVDHDGELDGAGPAEVVERVEGGPDGAPGEEDVVDQHDHPPGQVDGDVGDRLGQDGAQADVVAVEGHVEAADVEACRPPRSGAGSRPSWWRGGRRRSGARPGRRPRRRRCARRPRAPCGSGRAGRRRRSGPGSGPRTRPRGVAYDCVRVRPLLLLPCEPHGTHFTVRPQL